MIRAIDLGFGAVKAINDSKTVEYPSAVGNFRPVRFKMGPEGQAGLEGQTLKDKLCVEYEGKRLFIGNIAYTQGCPRVTLRSSRFTSIEGLAVLLSALVILANQQYEDVKLVTGLPVNDYATLKNGYIKALLGKHHIQVFEPDGRDGRFYSFNIQDVKVLPQPVGTIFSEIFNQQGKMDKDLARGKIGVIDVGKFTVDLAVTEALDFVDKSSTSYSDIGLFDAFKELSLSLKNEGYDIPPDSLEPYVRSKRSLNGLAELKDEIFVLHAEKIASRVLNMWSDYWSFDQVFVAGGGAAIFGEHLKEYFGDAKITICDQPTMSNCDGYYKYGLKVWQ